MTVDAYSEGRAQIAGNGVTASVDTPFTFVDQNNIKVIHTDAAGVDTEWVYQMSPGSWAYTGGNFSTGTITFTASDLATGETLTVLLVDDVDQPYDLDNSEVDPIQLQSTVDHLAITSQAQESKISRAPKLKESTSSATPTFPEPSAGKLIGWNGAGDDLENKTAVDTTELLPATASTYLKRNAANTAYETKTATEVFADLDFYVTRSQAAALSIEAEVKAMMTVGYASAGDGGGGLYSRVDSEPSHEGKFRSADRYISDGTESVSNGGWWELVDRVVNPMQFGAVGDGSTDDTTALQNCFDFGRNVFIPDPATAYEITDTLILKTNGQVIEFENMRTTKIRNSTTADPLLYVGDPGTDDGYAQTVEITRPCMEGNALTTSGITVWGANAVDDFTSSATSWDSSSRNCVINDPNINEIGSGYALRVYAWECRVTGIRLFSNNQEGILLDWEAQKNIFIDSYITDCDNESIHLGGNGICRSNQFYGTVVQQSGGAAGCVEIESGENNVFVGLYSESNNSKSAPCVVKIESDAESTRIADLTHLSGGGIIVIDDGKNSTIENVWSNSNLTASLVKLETNSENAVLINCDHASGTTVPNPIWDNSTAKTATVIGGAEFITSFTPSFAFVTVTSYSVQTGLIKRVGGLAMFEITMTWSGLDTADTSTVSITGLPALLKSAGFAMAQIDWVESTGLSFSSTDWVQPNVRTGNQDIELVRANGGKEAYDGGNVDASGTLKIRGSFMCLNG